MYIQRHAEHTVERLAAMFGAVLVTGSRQVGKTTMVQQVAAKRSDMSSVSLDDPILLESARSQGGTFLKDNPPPLFIDEIQRAPHLFMNIKLLLDRDENKKGQFFLSGPQQFKMMKEVSESLAGRLGLIHLLGLSLREMNHIAFSEPFLPVDTFYSDRKQELAESSSNETWETIQRGCLPELAAHPDYDWQMYYGSYVRTYIDRDVRELTQVGDEVKFTRFIVAAAARTGQLLNLASLARDVGISQPTAERWLSILVTSNIVYLLQPYHHNLLKRIVKTPKLYFLDTGLAAYLTRWNTAEVLRNGAQAGAFFETFVIAEIIKSYCNAGILDPPLYFYRDKENREIDLLIEINGTLHPLEIKKHADPNLKDIASFRVIDDLPGVQRGPGGVICLYDKLITLQGDDKVIPLSYL